MTTGKAATSANFTTMKRWILFLIALLALAGIFGVAGCGTTSSNVIKERGVYTTMAMEGQNLDLPASGYTSCKTFGPGQTPAAVVVGYGYWEGTYNRPQAFNLEVVEVTSGTVVLNRSGNALAGKAEYINLPIRKSGDYQLKLIINDSVYDTWDFTVNREVPADAASAAAQPRVYAKGNFSTSIEGLETSDAFNQYDDSLLQAFNDAVQKEYANANHDDFAQVTPGRVVVQFDLSETGQVSLPKIIENTLNETLGQFFLRALQSGSPYKAWPATVRAAIGTGLRSVKVTFFYD
jgi:hypothetical protein